MSSTKTAVVTGASRGIGRAIALELASRGYTVGINFHKNEQAAASLAQEIEEMGGQSLLLQGDVSQPEQVRTMFDSIDETLGHIDALVCNAGITKDTLLGASQPEDFQEVIDINLYGVVNVCRLASMRMLSRRRGSIVNISSVSAQHPGRGQSNYAASKGAIEAFSRSLAVELARRNVRVNVVAPGIIETDMTSELRAIAPDELKKRILLKRIGKPEEVAKVVAFLCGEDSSYVTGQIWRVDGGFKLD